MASDFSVFHRVGDIYSLPGPVLFRFAWRLPAYEGVMRSVAMEAADSPATTTPSGQARTQRDVNPGTRVALRADPAFSRLISFGTPGR